MLLTDATEQFRKYLLLLERSNETIKCYLKDLKYFNQFLLDKYSYKEILLESITSSDVQDFLYYIFSEKHYAPNSRRRSLNSIKCLYNYCLKRKLCSINITAEIDHIKLWQKERTFLTESEVVTLISCINSPLIKTLTSTLYYTGLRISECIHLELDQVDLINEVIYVKGGKGNKDRRIPISKKLKIILNDYLNSFRPISESTRFFTTRTGSISASYVNKVLNICTKQAGINKHVTAHILGHAHLRTTCIYIHTTIEDLRDSVDVL